MSKLKDLHWLYMHNALYIKHKVYIMQCTMIRQMMVGGKIRLSTIISNSCNKDYLRSLHQKENGSRARLGWGTKVTDLGLCKKPTLIDGWSSHHCTRPWYFNIKCQMRIAKVLWMLSRCFRFRSGWEASQGFEGGWVQPSQGEIICGKLPLLCQLSIACDITNIFWGILISL